MGLITRLLGICRTARPKDAQCWTFSNGIIQIDMNKMPEISGSVGAVRLEGRGMPVRVLLVRTKEKKFYAYTNRCTHMGRRIDPINDLNILQCCSVSKSAFDYSGQSISGPAKKNLTTYPVIIKDHTINIILKR